MENRLNVDQIQAIVKSLNISEEAQFNLTRNLDKIVTGSKEIFTTPIAITNSPENIIQEWDKIFNSNLSKVNDVLLDLELSNRSKYGPRSLAKPWSERRQSVMDYYESDVKEYKLQIPLNNSAGRLRPISLVKAISYLKNTSNTGLPFMIKKSRVKGSISSDWSDLLQRKDPCVLFTRTQENLKTRNVFGFPIADTINEMMFYRPLLAFQSKLHWRSALRKPDAVDLSMNNILETASRSGKSIVSVDFSSYDASVKTCLQRYAFKYISDLFQKDSNKKDIEYISNRFNTIGLVTPDGVLNGRHGVPSGSTFTNEVDSIVQYLVATQCSVTSLPFQIQGDDGVYITLEPHKLFDCFESYGLNVNIEKSKVSPEYAIYLQSLYHKDYRNIKDDKIVGGVYPTYRALCRIVYQERFDDFSDSDISGKDYFAIRTLSILENCRNHPLFELFVKFILSLDKYKLRVSDLGLRQFVGLRRKQEGKDVTFRTWSYGEDISGLKSFYSYKIVESNI